MSDIKFSCPACGQHLSCESSYVGRQINCPACHAPVRVTASAAPPPLPGPTVAPKLAGPPPVPQAAPTPAVKPAATSGLALASLICSCAGLFFAFFGTIPGIILGFKAFRQLKANPGMGGKGLATAGVITGSILTLVWIPLTFIVAVGVAGGLRAVQQLKNGTLAVQATNAAPNEDVTTDLAPDGSGWMADLEGVSLPDTPVAGRMQGLAFTPGEIELSCAVVGDLEFAYRLSTSTREELISLTIEFDQAEAAKYSGRTLKVQRDGSVSVAPAEGWSQRPPRLRMVWIEPGPGRVRDRMHDTFTQSYPCALRLEFGELKDGKLPGRIYLCVLDRKKSFLRGKFVAVVKQNGWPAGGAIGLAGGPRSDEPPSDTNPDSAGWTLDLSSVTIPEVTATGRVHGVAYKTDRVTIEGPMLKLRQGAGFFADREFEILIWEAARDPGKLSGRTIEVLPGDMGSKPHVGVSWMDRGRQIPDSLTAQTYAMRLELGELKNGRLSGRIYLCVADRDKSFVRGKFIASVPQAFTPPAPTPGARPVMPPNFPIRRPPGGR